MNISPCCEFKKIGLEEMFLAEDQGKAFEKSGDFGYGSKEFIEFFMHGEIAERLDSFYDPLQWGGPVYMFDQIRGSVGNKDLSGEIWNGETLFWIGSVYRYWHCLTGDTSREIYLMANPEKMIASWHLHYQDIEYAIKKLREEGIQELKFVKNNFSLQI